MRSNWFFGCRCGRNIHPGRPILRTVGINLMVVGTLILLITVPIQVWFAAIGLIMLVFGFILWRLG